MGLDQKIAEALRFSKPYYTQIERERRWLCRELPRDEIVQTERITDLYVVDSRLRLREARPLEGGAPMLRLSRKVDIDAATRLISSIYLPEEEFAMLAGVLSGSRLSKLRHRLQAPLNCKALCVDEFQGALAGLWILEAEFDTAEQLQAFPAPAFAGREITTEPCYAGGNLAKAGLPQPA